MAGTAKPDIQDLGDEANYKVISGSGGSGSLHLGLFDSTTPNEWNTVRVMYWSSNLDFLEIEFEENVRIHRYYSWNNNNNQRLKIMRHNGTGYNEDLTNKHLDISTQEPLTWGVFTEILPEGKYRFSLDSTDTGLNGRCDGEWYIESHKPPTTDKILLLSEDMRKITPSTRNPKIDVISKNFNYNSIENDNRTFLNKRTPYGQEETYLGVKSKDVLKLSNFSLSSSSSRVNEVQLQAKNDHEDWVVLLTSKNLTFSHSFSVKPRYQQYRLIVSKFGYNTEYIVNKLVFNYDEVKVIKEFSSNKEEEVFIRSGLPQREISSIDFSSEFTEKHYIQDESTPLGEGKVFKHDLDVSKIIKKVKIK